MNPQRLIPYVVVFLVLAGAYGGLHWYQGYQVTREKQAKEVFKLQAPEIVELNLIRGKEEIRLAKKKQVWELEKPLTTRADQTVVDQMVSTLAGLQKERDLGPEADRKTFGLETPSLVVSFTAQGSPHKLAIGNKAPGGRAYYALKDQEPHTILISAASKEALDKTLPALRDKTLLSFVLNEVKSLKIRTDKTEAQLEKSGPQAWRRVGRPHFSVRGDRVEKLLRDLQAARINDFLAVAPKDLRAAGLAPKPQTEITLVTNQGSQTLMLGARKGKGVYARKEATGPVVLVNPDLPAEIAKAVTSLEDRRLWTGQIPQVQKMTWGPPSQTWAAVKEKESWKLSGPRKTEVQQPAVRVEMALWNLQNLEYLKVLPRASAPAGKERFAVELFDGAGKPRFRLEELGKTGKDEVEVQTRVGEKTTIARLPRKKFTEWQEELGRLTSPPPKK